MTPNTCGCTIVRTDHAAIVHTIEPSGGALRVEEVVKLFSTACEQKPIGAFSF